MAMSNSRMRNDPYIRCIEDVPDEIAEHYNTDPLVRKCISQAIVCELHITTFLTGLSVALIKYSTELAAMKFNEAIMSTRPLIVSTIHKSEE